MNEQELHLLKIASNNVFGYYIEVRNTHKDKVPEEWIRKQTLVNAERYITEELKEYESKILRCRRTHFSYRTTIIFRIGKLDEFNILNQFSKMHI